MADRGRQGPIWADRGRQGPIEADRGRYGPIGAYRNPIGILSVPYRNPIGIISVSIECVHMFEVAPLKCTMGFWDELRWISLEKL